MDMNIQKYLAFLMTCESGSFTKAAEALHYSQSGVSRMIGDLERDWKVTLLERNRAGVSLTSDGLRLLPVVQSVCREYRRLQTRVEELNNLQSGLIRIGTFSSVATHWLPRIIGAFQKDHPNIEYELLLGHYAEIEDWILEGRVDCGFTRLPAHPELETIFLERDKLLVVMPEGHPMAKRKRFPVSALSDYPFMLLEKERKAEISELLERHGVSPDVRFTTVDDYAVMSMVENGLGIGILPQLILRRIPYRVVAKELNVPAYRNIGLALRSADTASLAVRRFLEYLPFRRPENISAT